MESLQERLKAVRGAMTQSEFATRLRTPLTTLGRYERGANMPDLEFIINVCTVFDVSPGWLLFGRGAMREQSKEHLASGCGCRQCPLLLKELEEERAERRELSTENRQLYAENCRGVQYGIYSKSIAGCCRRTGVCARNWPVSAPECFVGWRHERPQPMTGVERLFFNRVL